MRRLMAAAALLLACATTAAAPVKYTFSGVIDSGSSTLFTHPGDMPVAIGDRFEGSLLYDPADAGAIGGETWLFAAAFDLSVDGKLSTYQPITSASTNFWYGRATNEALLYTNGPRTSGISRGFLDDVYLSFRIPAPYEQGALPEDPMLDALGTGQLRMWFVGLTWSGCTPICSGAVGAFGTITSVSRVPEPATLGLLALGLIGTGALGRKTRRR